MTISDWEFIRTLAKNHAVTFKAANVSRKSMLGSAIDKVLATSGHHPLNEQATCRACNQ